MWPSCHSEPGPTGLLRPHLVLLLQPPEPVAVLSVSRREWTHEIDNQPQRMQGGHWKTEELETQERTVAGSVFNADPD